MTDQVELALGETPAAPTSVHAIGCGCHIETVDDESYPPVAIAQCADCQIKSREIEAEVRWRLDSELDMLVDVARGGKRVDRLARGEAG